MSARRFTLEEVERAFRSATSDFAPDFDDLNEALNALPEEPDLLAEAVGLLRVIREADMLREHAYEAGDDDGSVYDQLRAFLDKVKK